jgi:endonuclease-3
MPAVARPKTAAERKLRLTRILASLDRRYPRATCALHHASAWELLVATILSAQCTDERVNKVTPVLFRKYPTLEAFARAPLQAMAADVRSTGFFNNKARNIIGAAQTILANFGGQVPRKLEDLLTVPGAARKTANVVLGTAFGIASGVVVDTHVGRIARRLDLTRHSDPVKVERDLIKLLPPERWIQFSHQVIHFGREICAARKPRCLDCPLQTLCYAKDKTA